MPNAPHSPPSEMPSRRAARLTHAVSGVRGVGPAERRAYRWGRLRAGTRRPTGCSSRRHVLVTRSAAPETECGAEHEEAADDRDALDAGGDERLADGALLDTVAEERRGGGHAGREQQQAAVVERGHRERGRAARGRSSGGRTASAPRAVEPAGERPGAQHGDQRGADERRAGEEQPPRTPGPAARRPRRTSSPRPPRARSRCGGRAARCPPAPSSNAAGRAPGSTPVPRPRRPPGRRRRTRPPTTTGAVAPAVAAWISASVEPPVASTPATVANVERTPRRAATSASNAAAISAGGTEGAHGLILPALGRGIGEVIAALAQEPPARGAAHVQRIAQLDQVPVDRRHAAPPAPGRRPWRTPATPAATPSTARRPAGVSR